MKRPLITLLFADRGVARTESPPTLAALDLSERMDLGTKVATATRTPGRLPVKTLIAITDLAAVVVSMAVAFHLRLLLPGDGVTRPQSAHVVVAAVSLPLWFAVFVRYGLYRANKVAGRRAEFGRLVHAAGTSVAAMALVAFVAALDVPRGWLVLTFVVAVFMLTAERELIRRLLTHLRLRGRLLRRVLIVGGNADAEALYTALMTDAALGYHVVGFVGEPPMSVTLFQHPPVMGSIDDTLRVAREVGAQGVIVVVTAVGMAAANRLARELPDAGIRVEVVTTLRDIAIERLELHALGRFPVLNVQPVRRQGWRAVAKRAFDVSLAGSGLVLLAPVMGVMALAVKITSRGPILFRQERLGREGKPFKLVKFRTMVTNAEDLLIDLTEGNEADGPLFKMRRDPRVTKAGRYLRRLSLDELPQLWNVLRGEMSLVGPRPALPCEVTGWSPELHQRLRAKPGMTGMWQVRGRSNASFDDYTRLDLYYVDNWSLLVDLTILVQTIPAVFFGRGAR